jgi:hypothetical protein
MAEEGPGATLQCPKVKITSIGPDISMMAPLGMECNNTSSKTIKDYMRKSSQFRYRRRRSSCNTPFPGGANCCCRP